MVLEQYRKGVGVAPPRGGADEVDGIAPAPGRRQHRIEANQRLRRQLGEAAAFVDDGVGREDAKPAAVGHDYNAVAGHRRAPCQDRLGAEVGEGGVEATARNDDAKAVRTDDSQQVRPRRVEHRLAQGLAAGDGALAETGGDDHRRLGAPSPERGDEPRHNVGWRGDDRKVGRLRQAGDVRVARFAVDSGMLRVDQHEPACKAAASQVARQHGADGGRLIAGPE